MDYLKISNKKAKKNDMNTTLIKVMKKDWKLYMQEWSFVWKLDIIIVWYLLNNDG